MATKTELLALAKSLEIVGRHDMTKEQLEAAVAQHNESEILESEILESEILEYQTLESSDETESEEIDENDESNAPTVVVDVDVKKIKDVVRRYPSMRARDESGRVVRTGKNLSGNVPFKRKYYFINSALANKDWTADYTAAFNAAPKQVQGIISAMFQHYCGPKNIGTGTQIVNKAKEHDFVVSKIDSDKLFAYYRRALETLGVIYAGSFTKFEEEDGE